MWRDREIKLRLYPSLGIFIIFPFLGFFDEKGSFSAFAVCMAVWMIGILPISALETLRMSSNHIAAEIFLRAPIASAAPIFHGVRKASIYFLLLPSMCVSLIMIWYFAPQSRGALLLALPGVITMPIISLLPGYFDDYLPLSRPTAVGEQAARNSGMIFASMLGMGLLLGLFYFAWKFGFIWILLAVELIAVIFIHWTMSKRIKNRAIGDEDREMRAFLTKMSS